MRASRSAGRSYGRYALAANHEIALPNQQRRAMRVATDQPITVIDFEHFTIGGMDVREDDPTARGGVDRGTGLGRKVDPLMKAFLSIERIDAPAEVGRKPPILD